MEAINGDTISLLFGRVGVGRDFGTLRCPKLLATRGINSKILFFRPRYFRRQGYLLRHFMDSSMLSTAIAP
jgi:hypothetical protein